MHLSVCPQCSSRHSRLWLTPGGCCLLKHLHPRPGEAATCRQRGSAAPAAGGCSQRCSHTGATVERGARGGGLGTEGEVEEEFGVQEGLSSTHHDPPSPRLRGLGDSVLGHLPSNHNSAAESGVLPLLPEQQHSEKPSSLIRLMQVGAGGWYRLPLRAPAGGQRAGLSRAGQLLLGFLAGGYGSVSPRWEEGPCNLLYRCPQAQMFWGDDPPPLPSHITARAMGT